MYLYRVLIAPSDLHLFVLFSRVTGEVDDFIGRHVDVVSRRMPPGHELSDRDVHHGPRILGHVLHEGDVFVVNATHVVTQVSHGDGSHERVEGVEHSHAGFVLAHDDLRPASVRDLVRTDLLDSVVEFYLHLLGPVLLSHHGVEVEALFFIRLLELCLEMFGLLLVMHHHLEDHHVAGVGRRSIGDVADGRHLGGYTCGVRGRLESEEGYGTLPYPVHFPSTASPSSKGGTSVYGVHYTYSGRKSNPYTLEVCIYTYVYHTTYNVYFNVYIRCILYTSTQTLTYPYICLG